MEGDAGLRLSGSGILHDGGLLDVVDVERNEEDLVEVFILFVDAAVDHQHVAVESARVGT